MHKNQFLFAFIFNFNLTTFIVKSNKEKTNKKANSHKCVRKTKKKNSNCSFTNKDKTEKVMCPNGENRDNPSGHYNNSIIKFFCQLNQPQFQKKLKIL